MKIHWGMNSVIRATSKLEKFLIRIATIGIQHSDSHKKNVLFH